MKRVLLVLFLFLSIISNACSENDGTGESDVDTDTDADSDADSDSDADTDTDTDTDSDTGVDGDTDSDAGMAEDFVWFFPEGATFDAAYGDATVQIVDTDFDTTGVDLTLAGLNQDIPAPTVDCMDDTITQDCISLAGFDRSGQYFQVLCLGQEGVNVGGSNEPIEQSGAWCDTWATDPVSVDVFIESWSTVPVTLEYTVNNGDDPPLVLLDTRLWGLENAPWHSTGSGILIDAKLAGWVVHTLDYGDPTDSVLTATYAASYDDSREDALRYRGTIKAYF